AEGEYHRKLGGGGSGQLSDERDVSRRGPVELPGHRAVPGEVRPAVARPDETRRTSHEGKRGAEGHRHSIFLRGEDRPSQNVVDRRAVAPPSDIEVGSGEEIAPQPP